MGKRRRKKKNRVLWKIIFLVVVIVGVADVYFVQRQVGSGDTVAPAPGLSKETTPASSPTPLPSQAVITVPFQVQAPYANWDALHEEACEEASLLMVKHFLDATAAGSADQADKELMDMIAYETATGFGPSITLADLRKVADSYYSLTKGRLEYEITAEDIKRELARES